MASLPPDEKQIIEILKAVSFDPWLIILDEATATIDTRTEQLIQLAVERIAEGRTSIIIAHRLSTIRHVDRVLVFEAGRIVEEGGVRELLSKDTRFRKLYELQKAEVLD